MYLPAANLEKWKFLFLPMNQCFGKTNIVTPSNQGDILKNKGTETEPAGFPRSWKNSPPQSVPLRAGQSLSQRDRLYQPWVDGDGWEARKRYPGSPALCSRRRGTATGKLAGAGRSGPGQPDSMGVYGT